MVLGSTSQHELFMPNFLRLYPVINLQVHERERKNELRGDVDYELSKVSVAEILKIFCFV